ncbi:NEL-type E3 ubiquitin ligase domain-containing protein [Pseudomonas entomophila]|uniref:RING-type E3 ubiquitin transferase n=2 Tax=Pseudomonas entomophila TaxID=312306 RepID=Q1I7U3_PSEE4|nr:NEL-type E3 ubiquitin ligase domain-containing protein [Pseudomonas entomophila]WMW07953.1 NEL-type E3 ubiquitin ligase domain-containing protein [Pseudomonas entomophila]CAK16285.1 Hypothetical protein; putative leucine-rich repeat domain protein [Pseudomonas entomophila L48]
MKANPPAQPVATKLERSHKLLDDFIGAKLPAWLKQASVHRLKALHEAFTAHEKSRKRLAQATSGLVSAQQFAEQKLKPMLEALLPDGPALDALEWISAWYEVSPIMSTPSVEPRSIRLSARLRLMQNFSASSSFFVATGLVRSGASVVLVDPDDVARRCRTLDLGKQYQTLIGQVLTPANRTLLAQHKRDAFALMCELALCREQISVEQYMALSQLASAKADQPGQQCFASAGELRMLGCIVENALKIQLRDGAGEDKGVILYVPDDGQNSLRYFQSSERMALALVSELGNADIRRDFRERIRLRDRAAFSKLLDMRLSDDAPDLALEAGSPGQDIFTTLANSQIGRFQDDGKLLLVSSADADQRAANERLEAWTEFGLSVLGLAGLGIPIVGVALFATLVVDTLAHVYEGVVDWSEGHQHEALEHLFHVAETVAITAATAAGATVATRVFARSAFVDDLDPVKWGGGSRLWSADLQVYESDPGAAPLLDNGLYGEGTRRWLRVEDKYYELKQDLPGKSWRLRHASREDGFGPPVDFNGERSWRIRLERPLEWDDSTLMLNRLWPMDPPLSDKMANRILRVAGVDKDELRGVLVENRPAPVALRDTLRRYMATQRITALFSALKAPNAVLEDAQLMAWCKARDDMRALDEEAIGKQLLARRHELWEPLQKYLAEETLLAEDPLEALPDEAVATDELLVQLQSEFPGLPPAYAAEALQSADSVLRRVATDESRLPMAILRQVRPLLFQARLTRALEGLLLGISYSDGTGELVLGLLSRLANWPRSINLELREGSPFGRLISVMDPQGVPGKRTILVWRSGQFHLYDAQGMALEREVEAPGGLFQALIAVLGVGGKQALELSGAAPAEQLREAVIALLPNTRAGVVNRLGWRPGTPRFNPGRRLPDGRVGYTLGGSLSRSAGTLDTLRQRARALYPSLSVVEVDRMVHEWEVSTGDAIEELLSQETNFTFLDDALIAWEREPRSRSMRNRRRQFSNRLRGAWRYEGETVRSRSGDRIGRVLNTEGWRVGTLPELPAEVDMGHIYELRMSGMDLLDVQPNFLGCFDSLESLNLNNNLLTSVPAQVTQLPRLRRLELRSNRIHMNAAGTAALSRLEALETLVLDFNPLRSLDLDFSRLTRLEVLRVNRCSLRSVPAGLERCAQLIVADLRFNLISTVPNGLMATSRAFRRRVNLDGNPLPLQTLTAFMAGDAGEPVEAPQPAVADPLQRWLETVEPQARPVRRAMWLRVQQLQGSTELFNLLASLTRTQDFIQAPDYIGEQVWQLIEDLDTDTTLRDDLFTHAGVQLTCHDSVAERFSRIWLRALVHHAEAEGKTGHHGDYLLRLGRALYRLDRLDEFAREEVMQREALGQDVDELEVVLGLRVELADTLGLIGQPRSMLFSAIADITVVLKERAVDAVLADETDGQLVQSLVNREFWRDYLKQRHATLFAKHDEEFVDKLAELDEQAMSSDEYLKACNAVATEREASERAVLLALSQDVLDQEALGLKLDPEDGESAQPD